MTIPNTHRVECDILIIGGGMSGCGAAFEAKYWGQDLRVVLVEKAVIERTGATGEGLSAINRYMGVTLRLEHAGRLCQIRGERYDGAGA